MLMDNHIDSDSVAQTIGSPVTLAWENISVRTDHERGDFYLKKIVKKVFRISTVDDKPHRILNSVTGHADGGSLVAIMGPSGSGKTTFLAALARRIKLSTGCIRVNGCSVSREAMSKVAGYVPQFDAFPSALTAMEYVSFTCALRLDKRTSSKERSILATNIFAQLGLLESSDTFISKLSGGETKRLSLAVELVTKPKILFLDEPTSGLDTWTAMRVIESASAEARNGTLVFCSIHQPAMDLYKMFSHVILLANGKTAYYGTLENATKFFNSEGFHCPESFNEAEYYVKVVANGNLVDSLNATDSFYASECSTQVYDPFSNSIHWTASKMTQRYDAFDLESSQPCKPNQFVQFYWISWRIFLQARRTMFRNITDQFISFMSAILVFIFYFGINPRTQWGIQDVRGSLYIIASEVIFSAAYSVVYVLPYEIPLYLRENSMYSPGAYYIATVIGLIPKAVFHGLAFISMILIAVDLKATFITFTLFAIYVAVATITSSAYGILVSSWIENPVIATTIMAPIDLISYTMAGIFYSIRSMPAYLSWMKYLSIFYYTNEAFAIILWTTVDTIECYPNKDLPCIENGREVLAEYGYNESNLWLDASGLLLLAMGMHVLGYVGVKRRRVVKSMY